MKRKPVFPILKPKNALISVDNTISGNEHIAGASKNDGEQEKDRIFRVLFTKFVPHKKRKNKSFEDGYLLIGGRGTGTKYDSMAVLLDDESKEKAKVQRTKVPVQSIMHYIEDGEDMESFPVGSWEVEIDAEIPEEEFLSGRAFLGTTAGPESTVSGIARHVISKPSQIKPFVSFASSKPGMGRPVSATFIPLYNPDDKDALVLNRADWEANRDTVCPVVLDKALYRAMRPHQKEGVQFLYTCVTNSILERRGCILADQMGLGKSLQTIALLYTMLKQGPKGQPMLQRALIVAPSSLTENWRQEIRKWLGDEKLKCIVLGAGADAKQNVIDFKFGRVYKVAVISYELLRKFSKDLAGCVDIIVADEGHRLKSATGNKTIDALQALSCHRKVLLSGTILQNDLTELFAICDFVRPGCLGSFSSFQKVFEAPIVKSRDHSASEADSILGHARSTELKSILSSFILRRDASVNQAYLPALSSYALFCKPSDVQISMMKAIIKRRWKSMDSYAQDEVLVLLSELRKVCAHPSLQDEETPPTDNKSSGKMEVLVYIIQYIVHTLGERVVIVSQWTSMLSLVESTLKGMNISFCRLDGTTPVSKRQDIVDGFNKNNIGQVFLLSTAAGGAGLNLIGSNRLVLVDSHWNPAYDAQAMARIWRDGQKKDCFVYRLITTGTIEEKIYQRQMLKGELAKFCVDDSIEPGQADAHRTGSFSRQELKELFEIQIGTSCMTAEQLQDRGKSYVNKVDFSDDVVLHSIKDSCPITFVFDELSTRDISLSKQACETIPDTDSLQENDTIHDLKVSEEFEFE